MLNYKAINEVLSIPSPLTELKSQNLASKNIQLIVKRDDLIHPEISGNKWRKLYLNLLEAKKQGKKTILTYGGAFSNHIYATAAACAELGFNSIGIIRGDYADPNNPTLSFARSKGMKLVPVSKAIYRSEKEKIAEDFPEAYMIPEGGNNDQGRMGMKYLADELKQSFQHEECLVVLPVGTGCTFAGLVQHLGDNFSLLGINVLKNKSIDNEIFELIGKTNLQYEINHDFHFGGYAKTTSELIEFANNFFDEFQIALDPIYTAKAMYAVMDLISKDKFPQGKKIIIIHTGGLQGVIPFNQMNSLKLKF